MENYYRTETVIVEPGESQPRTVAFNTIEALKQGLAYIYYVLNY